MKKFLFPFIAFLVHAVFFSNVKASATLNCNLEVTTTANSITVENLDAAHVILKLFNPDFSINYICNDNCDTPTTIINSLEENVSYYLSVNLYNENWTSICAEALFVTTGGGTPPCTDNDNDGICMEDDCDDNNPNLPATVGSSCDDGNNNTENDVIQADGCTCSGTPVSSTCDIDWTTTNNSITITGLNAPHVIFKLHNPNWTINTQCFDNCTDPFTISGLTTGATYHLNYNLYDDYWQPICGDLVSVVITGQNNGAPDLTIANLQSDASGLVGTMVDYYFDLKNIGNETAAGSYSIKTYLSEDNVLDNSDQQVDQLTAQNTPVGTMNSSGSFDTPDLPEGNYFLIVVADDNNEVSESNESNNTAFTNFEILPESGDPCGFLKVYDFEEGQSIDVFSLVEQADQFVLTGESASFVSGEKRKVTFTTNKAGELQNVSDQSFGPTPSNIQTDVQVTSDFDFLVTKTSFGNIDWETLVSFDLPAGVDILDTNSSIDVFEVEGGYLFVVRLVISPDGGSTFDFLLATAKLDEQGNELQQNVIADPFGDFFTLSSPFIVENGTVFNYRDIGNLSFVKFDTNGVFQWETIHAGDLPSNTLQDIGLSPDGKFVYAANRNNLRVFLDKVDTDTGEKVYSLPIGTTFTEIPFTGGIENLAGFLLEEDGGVVTGVHSVNNETFEYGKLDASGNVIWEQSIELTYPLEPLKRTSDGGYYWVGRPFSSNPQNPATPEVSVLKTTATGEVEPACGNSTQEIDLGCDISYSLEGSNITFTGEGLNAAHVIVKVFGPSWNTLVNCFDNCGSSIDLTGLTPGMYRVRVNLYDANWSETCNLFEEITITGTNLQGSDSEVKPWENTSDLESALALYPNPAANEAFLDLSIFAGETATINIYNKLGQVENQIQLPEITTEPIHLTTQDLTAGMYLVAIKIENQKLITKKLIVTKL